jgi:predicted GNAT superfamily acetyltransferase
MQKYSVLARKVFLFLAILSSTAIIPDKAQALEKTGRLGVGMTNQLKNDFPAFSFKMQKSRSFAYGGMVGVSSNDNGGGYGVGLKLYRNIFDEPQLNFYMAGTGALLSNKINKKSTSGFQFDLSFGSEFHFVGLNSLGFSFEFGVSAYKQENFVFQTLGNHFVVSGIHFYL